MNLPIVAVVLASSVMLSACGSLDDPFDAPSGTAPAGRAGDPPPATPAPKRASGVYNPSTGQIEWHTYDGPPMETPAPRKRWWLF